VLLLTALYQYKLWPRSIYNIRIVAQAYRCGHDYIFKTKERFIYIYIILDFSLLLHVAEMQRLQCVHNAVECPYLLYATLHLIIRINLHPGSRVLVFDHYQQNQSCSFSNSTVLALAVLPVFVPIKSNVKSINVRISSKLKYARKSSVIMSIEQKQTHKYMNLPSS